MFLDSHQLIAFITAFTRIIRITKIAKIVEIVNTNQEVQKDFSTENWA